MSKINGPHHRFRSLLLALGIVGILCSCASAADPETASADAASPTTSNDDDVAAVEGDAVAVDDPVDQSTTTTGSASEDTTDSEEGTGTATTDAGEGTTTGATVASDEQDSIEAPSSSGDCESTAALFVTGPSANPDLEDPRVDATCDGDTIVVVGNAVPDYTYIGTSPGVPGGREVSFSIPATPTMADAVTDVPYLGAAAVTLTGIPIYGPTEGTGGDVDSLPGIISACGSHMGPTGFHTHKILTSTETDCLFTPEEVAAGPQLVGYAFDGFPIYTGGDLTSSWQLTDQSLFASDTWAAHTYVEGSGDLDRCNGRLDADGNYAYFTTEGFPYVLGCFVGEVSITEAGRGGGDDGARPERPEGGDGEEGERPERPAQPEDGEDPPEGAEVGGGDRPERPARPEDDGGERPEPGEGEDGARPERPARPDDGGGE